MRHEACTCSERQLEQVGCECGAEYRIIPIAVFSFEGTPYEVSIDGDEAIVSDYYIGADVITSRGETTLVLRHKFPSKYNADLLIRKMMDRGYIDPMHWYEAEQDELTLAEKAEYEYMEEQHDRLGWGAQ